MSVTNWAEIRGRGGRFRPPPPWRSGRGDTARHPGGIPPLTELVAVPRLVACFEDCRKHGGPAPGPDGLTFSDFGRGELVRALERVRAAVLGLTYRAPASRAVAVPKKGGGTRELALDNVVHRVLASSVEWALAPALAPFMSAITHSACGRGVHTLLAVLYWAVALRRLCVLVNHDVRAAFPSLPVAVAMFAFRKYVADPAVLRLVELLLRGADGGAKHVGIPQGLALSPLALDLSMSTFFDRPWAKKADSLAAARYVDNLAFLAATKDEGRRAVDRCRTLLGRIGLALKPLPEEEYLVDLRAGGTSELLGFSLSATDGGLKFDITPTAWGTLRDQLGDAHRTPNPPLTARSVVTGWVAAMGPAFDSTRPTDLTGRVLDAAGSYGFREFPPALVRTMWTGAAEKWNDFLHRHRTS